MTVSASATRRFRKAHPCPICGGGDDMPRGQGRRCSGYLSTDGRFAYCTREEHAGEARVEFTEPPSYRHILEGKCNCGQTHAPAREDDLLAAYDYVDADGTLLYQVVRKSGKRFVQRRPDGNGGWIWDMQGVTRVLYRLPAVLATALSGGTVYIVEGEKDVHAIEQVGGVATTSPQGAGKWHSEYADALKGANIIIVADRDEAGLNHARQVAQTLPAATTTIVQAAEGKDAHDHLAAGRTLAELEPVTDNGTVTLGVQPIIFETLRAFLKRPLPKAEALIGTVRGGTNLLPRYGWVMPWGKEGAGKTSVLVDLLFHAASGINWLHYPIMRQLRIVIVINEGVPGGLQDKIDEKTELWPGNTDLVLDNLAIYVSPWGEFTFKDERMTDHARNYALDFKADYIALDPLHTLGTTGAGTPQETEEFKHLLRKFGLWKDLGVITAHHSNKIGMVSGDWGRHVDTLIRLEKDGKRPATKFTLEKARPADPHEIGVPQLLEWETDTMGYRHVPLENPEKVSDETLLERIHSALEEAAEALTMGALQDAVQGDSKRISALAKREIQAGRISDHAPRKDRYLLTSTLPGAHTDTDNTDKPGQDQQTRINTDTAPGDHTTPTSNNSESPLDGGRDVGVPPSPLKGATQTTPTTSQPLTIPEDAGPPSDPEVWS